MPVLAPGTNLLVRSAILTERSRPPPPLLPSHNRHLQIARRANLPQSARVAISVNRKHLRHYPASSKGAHRDRHEARGGNAVDATALTDERRCRGRAKSCGPGAPMQAPSPGEAEGFAWATVANAGSPGRARISRKPLRGEGRCDSACTCDLRAFAQLGSREGSRVHAGTRSSLRPPYVCDEGRSRRKSGRNASRERCRLAETMNVLTRR